MTIRERHALKLALDVGLTAGLLLLWAFPLTGLALHEWLGVALLFAILAHLLANWAWIEATTRRFFRALRAQVRFHYILNMVLFVAMTIVLFSGLMISVVALPFFGLHGTRSTFLTFVHILASDVLLVIVGLHLALNWRWVVNTARTLAGRKPKRIKTPVPRLGKTWR